MKKFIFIIVCQLLILSSGQSKKFRFKFPDGGKQRIEAAINGTYTISDITGTIINKADYLQKYTTIMSFKGFNENTSDIINENYYYSTNRSFDNTLKQLSDTSTTKYVKDIFGKIYIDPNAKYPTYRNVPIFPEKELVASETWENKGTEVQDFFADDSILLFPIGVKYVYMGEEEKDGKKLSKFEYTVNTDVKNKSYANYFPDTPEGKLVKIDNRIIQVLGVSKTIMYFDNETGSRVEEDYKRDYSFMYISRGQIVIANFKDSGKRIWHPVELMKKDDVVKDIKKDIKKLDNTKVEKDDKGIKISLENIQFYPNSTKLLPGEEDRLNKIANILKKYKDRGVMIIGHTTDRGTPRGRRILSINRAKTILEYLKRSDAINAKKSSYTGMGGDKPIADNNTEEGRSKNRRVEIYILED